MLLSIFKLIKNGHLKLQNVEESVIYIEASEWQRIQILRLENAHLLQTTMHSFSQTQYT